MSPGSWLLLAITTALALTTILAWREWERTEKIDAAFRDLNRKETMSELTAAERDALPDSAFALSGRRYPIHDIAHARNALARVDQHGTPEERKKVRAAVYHRYPSIEQNLE